MATSSTTSESSPFRRLYDRLAGRSVGPVETPPEPARSEAGPVVFPESVVVGQRFRAVDWERTAPPPEPARQTDPFAPPNPDRLRAVGQRLRAVNWTRESREPASAAPAATGETASSQNQSVDAFFSEVNW